MTPSDDPGRLEDLRQRLAEDPDSRLFVQLAEEQRRHGQLAEAVTTLRHGIERHPTYVSARLLLGRCHLEAGRPREAIPELQQVLERDQTHPLAQKLLAEAHLEVGDGAEAARHLDLYALWNDTDPEVDDLRARINALFAPRREPPAAPAKPAQRFGPGAFEPKPVEEPPREEEPFELEPFDLEPVEAAGAEEPGQGDDLFELEPVRTPPAPEEEDLLGIWAAAPAAEPESREEAPTPPHGDPFGDLLGGFDRKSWEARLASEGLFDLGTGPELPAPPAPEPEAPEPAIGPEIPAAPQAPPAAGEERRATVTLGRLYLQQGHREEAEQIFRQVLERDPGNATAQEALARVSTLPVEIEEPPPEPVPEPPPEEEDEEPIELPPEPGEEEEPFELPPEPSREEEPLEVAAPPPQAPAPRRRLTAAELEDEDAAYQGLTERKVGMLGNYLRRLRRAAEHHVS